MIADLLTFSVSTNLTQFRADVRLVRERTHWYDRRMTTVVFDMDGVLYRGKEALPHASEVVGILRRRKVRLGFLTNNSVRTRLEYADILAGHGIEIRLNEVMTSGEATARHLIAGGQRDKRVYAIGGKGLVETLDYYGFAVETDGGEEPCDFVIIGWDREFTFHKIVRAQSEILYNGAKLIATNTDAMFPSKDDRFLPGAGAMVAAVERASGVKAEVIGKPETISLRYLLDELGASPDTQAADVWMVGDRLDTDIACGNAYGARTVCVTTGIATREQAENAESPLRPEFIIDSLDELPGLIDDG